MNKAFTNIATMPLYDTELPYTSVIDVLRRIAREDALLIPVSTAWPSNAVRNAVRNHAGGYVNHELYFSDLSPSTVSVPEFLATSIELQFGSLDAFKMAFLEAASKVAATYTGFWQWLGVSSLPPRGCLAFDRVNCKPRHT
jgi:superoxide dismutase